MIKISQSLIKDLQKEKTCSKQTYQKYVLGDFTITDPSDSMLLGQYFEYKATGALPKGGVAPEPVLLKSGKLGAPYERAQQSAELFQLVQKIHKIEIEQAGAVLENDIAIGTADIMGTIDGEPCIIDLKYSGHINSDFRRWSWQPDAVAFNPDYILQATHYAWLAGRPFYFMVFSASEPEDYRLMRVHIDEAAIAAHAVSVRQLFDKVQKDSVFWDTPNGNRSLCIKCNLRDTCPGFSKIVDIEDVYPQ